MIDLVSSAFLNWLDFGGARCSGMPNRGNSDFLGRPIPVGAPLSIAGALARHKTAFTLID